MASKSLTSWLFTIFQTGRKTPPPAQFCDSPRIAQSHPRITKDQETDRLSDSTPEIDIDPVFNEGNWENDIRFV